MTSQGIAPRWRAWQIIGEIAALLLILSLAAYLRLANHAYNPGWYTDEGTHVDIARHLLRGQVQYLAINQSALLFAKMPLFEVLLAAWLGVWDGGIGALRTFTAWLAVLSVGLLYGVIRRTHKRRGRVLALLAALMLAIYPQAVLYSRMGFSYNLLTPLVLLTYLSLWEYLDTQRRSWLSFAALAVGLGAVADLLMLSLIPPLLLVASLRRRSDVLWSAVLAALPVGLYAMVMLVSAPQAFLFDLRFTLARLGGASLPAQLVTIAQNYTILVAQDAWIALAMVGLFIQRPRRAQRLNLLLFLLPVIVLGRTAALYGLTFYYMIPFLPWVALGVAALVRYGAPWIVGAAHRGLLALFAAWGWHADRRGRLRAYVSRAGAYVVFASVVAAPFLISTVLTLDRVHGNYGTVIDAFLINPEDAQSAANFVNGHTDIRDTVIASPAVAWLFQAQTADFQMAVAATGRATAHLPADIPADRFVFDPRYTQARFVVVDNLWRNWGAIHMPEVAALMHDVETWPLAFEAGEIAVYRNPTR